MPLANTSSPQKHAVPLLDRLLVKHVTRLRPTSSGGIILPPASHSQGGAIKVKVVGMGTGTNVSRLGPIKKGDFILIPECSGWKVKEKVSEDQKKIELRVVDAEKALCLLPPKPPKSNPTSAQKPRPVK